MSSSSSSSSTARKKKSRPGSAARKRCHTCRAEIGGADRSVAGGASSSSSTPSRGRRPSSSSRTGKPGRPGLTSKSDRSGKADMPPVPAQYISVGDFDFCSNHFLCFECGCDLSSGAEYFLVHKGASSRFLCAKDYEKTLPKCHGCRLPIKAGQEMATVLKKRYHAGCVRCSFRGCHEVLRDSFFQLDNRQLCGHHFELLTAAQCRLCKEPITAASGDCVEIGQGHKYHAACARCHACQLPFEPSSSVIQHGRHLYCRTDYIQLFGVFCSGCGEVSMGQVVEVNGEVFCSSCLACFVCGSAITHYRSLQGTLRCEHHAETELDVACHVCEGPISPNDSDATSVLGVRLHKACLTCVTCRKPVLAKTAKMLNGHIACSSCQSPRRLRPARRRDALSVDSGSSSDGSGDFTAPILAAVMEEEEDDVVDEEEEEEDDEEQQEQEQENPKVDNEKSLEQDVDKDCTTSNSNSNTVAMDSADRALAEWRRLSENVENKPAAANGKEVVYRKRTTARRRAQPLNGGAKVQDDCGGGIGARKKRATFSCGNIEDEAFNLQKGDVIGKGGFGRVFLALNSDGSFVAVKEQTVSTAAEAKMIENEVKLMRRLAHPNVVSLLGTQRMTDAQVRIVMEYVPGNSLHHILTKFGPLRERVARSYARQLASGLEFLHGQHVIHRDIKSRNILVGTTGTVKISDFGSAKHCEHSGVVCGESYRNTVLWTAPEVMKGRYDHKIDIWSLGCTILEMVTAKEPWSEMNFQNDMRALFYIGHEESIPHIPDTLSPVGQAFVRACLSRDPSARPSANELLRHEWLAGL